VIALLLDSADGTAVNNEGGGEIVVVREMPRMFISILPVE